MRIEQVQPARVRVTSGGRASVRVRGRGHGLLRCQGQLRWVFGDFDLHFGVTPEPGGLWLRGRGLWASDAVRVPCEVVADVALPHGVEIDAPIPSAMPVGARPPRLPRSVTLDRALLDSLAQPPSSGAEALR